MIKKLITTSIMVMVIQVNEKATSNCVTFSNLLQFIHQNFLNVTSVTKWIRVKIMSYNKNRNLQSSECEWKMNNVRESGCMHLCSI